MVEVYFDGCSPAYDTSQPNAIPGRFDQNVLETIATPPIRFSSCSLRGSVTSLYKKTDSIFGEFVIGVDGSYYNIKGLGISYDSNGVTIYSEQPAPSAGPASNDCAYNLNCVQLLCWDINRCSFGCFDVVRKEAISGCSCDVITNNACYFGAGTGTYLNSVGTDTMPLGIKYQGKPIVGNAGTVCTCSDGSQFFYGNNSGSGVLVSTPSNVRNQLYSHGYPLTRGGCVYEYQGIYSFPVYCDFCIACRGTYFNGFDSSVCSIDSDMAWYNGVTDAFYDTGCCCKFPNIYYNNVSAEVVYPRCVSLLKTCCCSNDAIHTIMPAPGDVSAVCPSCNSHTCIGRERCEIETWKTSCCDYGYIHYCNPSVVYGMQQDDIRRTDSSAYNSLMGLPIPLTFLTFRVDYNCTLAQFKSCVQNGTLPISLSNNGAEFSIRLPIVSKQRREYESSTSCNVWTGNEVDTEAALVYDPETERRCLADFTSCFYSAICGLYCDREYTCYWSRIPMCDIWNLLNWYMDRFDLYISEGYATDICYTPNVTMSSMSCVYTCVPRNDYWHRPIGSNNKAVSSFTQGVGAYDCFYNTMGEFKRYMDAGCWTCAINSYNKSMPGSGVSFYTSPIHYNGDRNSVNIAQYQRTKYVYAAYTTARPLIAAAWHNQSDPSTYCNKYYLLDETTLSCFNAQIGGKLNLNKVNRDVTYILGNCGQIIDSYCGCNLLEAKCVGCDMIPSSDVDITNCANLFYPSHGQYNNQTGWRECPGFHIITYPRIRVKWTMPWYIGSCNVMNREWY